MRNLIPKPIRIIESKNKGCFVSSIALHKLHIEKEEKC